MKGHAELHLLLSMITPLSWLERVPTYKDQIQQLKKRTWGLMVSRLSAADGRRYFALSRRWYRREDQVPHLEITREIARRFNYLYQTDYFPEPETMLNEVKILPGIDGRKMSKSYGNTIDMSEAPDEVRKKVRQMVTDPGRIRKDDPGNPDVCTVYAFHSIFNAEELAEVERACRRGEIGCVQCKNRLADRLTAFLAPIYEKRQALEGQLDYIRDILQEGAKRASVIAEQTMDEVREIVNLKL